MFISTDDLDWQSELEYANRAFAAMVGGQRYKNITREEVKLLQQSQSAHEAAPVKMNAGIPGAVTMTKDKAPPLWRGTHLAERVT